MYEYLPLEELFGMDTFSILAIAAVTKQYSHTAITRLVGSVQKILDGQYSTVDSDNRARSYHMIIHPARKRCN